MVERINKINYATKEFIRDNGGRRPTDEELSELTGYSIEVIERCKNCEDAKSLDEPIGEEEDSFLGDFVPDETQKTDIQGEAPLLADAIHEIMSELTEREQKVLRLRFGFDRDGQMRTLEEVGQEFNITRERIRQIEAKALRKLRHPSRKAKVKDFYH